MAKILITGGTGLVGGYLSKMLTKRNHEVIHLSRTPSPSALFPTYDWNIKANYIDPLAFDNVDHVIHLAGAGVAEKRWSAQRKQVIIDSRVQSIKVLKENLEKNNVKLKAFISASAIGYYGMDTGAAKLYEDSSPGEDYLAHVVKLWEGEADTLSENTTVAKVRIGVVLAKEGGALKQLCVPIKYFVGAPLGSGQQYMSWIHINDLCEIFIHILENNLSGTYNATAPNPVTNEALTKSIAKTLRKPLILPNVPAFVMRLLLGKMAEMVLGGNRAYPDKIQSTGFKFRFIDVDGAVNDLLK